MFTLPVLPLRSALIQPEAIVEVPVSRSGGIAACERARRGDGRLVVLAQRDPSNDDPAAGDMYDVGIIGRIESWSPGEDGAFDAQIAGESVVQILAMDTGATVWRAQALPLLAHGETVGTEELIGAMIPALRRRSDIPVLVLANLPSLSPRALAGFAALHAQQTLGPKGLQELLECSLEERIASLTQEWRRIADAVRLVELATAEPVDRAAPVEDDPMGEPPEDEGALDWIVELQARVGGVGADGLLERCLAEAELAWEDLDALDEAFDLDGLHARVGALVSKAHAHWKKQARQWPQPTQAERVRAVLHDLEAHGIATAWGDVHDLDEVLEAWQESGQGAGVRGALWLCIHDAEAAVRGAGIRLSFAAVLPGEDAAEIAREAVSALEAADLPVAWDGRAEVKIHVPVPWRVRLL